MINIPLTRFFAIPLLAITALSLSSCSDDDDGTAGGGKAPTKAGVIDSQSGLRLTGYNNYSYDYDEQGRLAEIYYGSDRVVFTYNPNKMTDYYDGDPEEEVLVTYNSSGYITQFSASDSGSDDEETWNDESHISISYDGSGHITKVTSSTKETGTDEDGRYTNTDNSTITFTWNRNRLTRAVWVEKETDSEGTDTYNETYTFDYDEDYENTFRQWTPSLAYNIGGDLEEMLAYAGFFGVGPDMLPSSGTYAWSDSDGKEGSSSYTYSYSYNAIGAVSTTYINGNRHSFSYDYADGDSEAKTRAAVSMPSMTSSGKGARHTFFSHRHSSHRR